MARVLTELEAGPVDGGAGPLTTLLRARRSCRAYDPDRPVPRDLLDQCVEAARLAPSACNRQPWRFVIVDDPGGVGQLRQRARQAGIPHPWWDQVPVFVALCGQRDLVTHRLAALLSGIRYDLLDLGIAGEHFVLAATARGLGTCWIGWFRARAVHRLLRLPSAWRVAALLTVGWPAADREPGPRAPRRALDEIRRWHAAP